MKTKDLKKQATVTFSFPNDFNHQYEIDCHYKALKIQTSVYNVLCSIRNRLKYEERLTKKEKEYLELIRFELIQHHVEG